MTTHVSRPTTRARLVVLLLAGALAAAACGGDDAEISYYESPSARDVGQRGEVVSDEPIALRELTSEGHRISYVSTTPADDTVHLTGVLIVPSGPVPEGGRPVAVWGHPTVGVGTPCAPSLEEPFELEGADQLLDAGFIIAAPDYDGLGSEGVHPYLVGESEGRAMLDMAQAAAAYGGGDQVVGWGHSQGGHASLWMRAIADRYAPDLDLLAVGAAAPPTDLAQFLDPGFTEPTILALTANAAIAWGSVYDGVDLAPLATPETLEAARGALESCFVDIAVAAEQQPPDEVWALGPDEVPDWGMLTAANSVDPKDGRGPVFISHGEADVVVPISGSEEFAQALCDGGETVVVRTATDWDHNTSYSETRTELFDWLISAVDGAELTSTC
jgi:pimeloyl-ACP methyl ester carboxylesterase